MKGQADLAGILRGMYSDVMGQAKILLAAPDITSDQFRKFNATYYSVLEEARQRQPDLYDEFRQNSEETVTGLRVKARAHAIEVVQDITALFSSLNSYAGGHEAIPEVGRLERKAPALLEQRQPEPQALDIGAIVSKYEIDHKSSDKLAGLIGTYATAKDISAIAGYTTSNFYLRIKGRKVKTDGKGGYLLDETTMPIFFTERDAIKATAEQQGTFMTAEDIRARFGYGNVVTVYGKLRDHKKAFQQKKEGRKTFYLVTGSNSKYLERQRHQKGTSKVSNESTKISELPSLTGKILTYGQMLDYARPIFGDRTDAEVRKIVDTYGKKLQIGEGRFSGLVLEQILEHNRRQHAGTNPKITSANNGDNLTFNGMVEFARERLGREGEDWVVQMISEHGDTLQKKHNQFSRARLEELLAQRK